jgi:hypothetical protein
VDQSSLLGVLQGRPSVNMPLFFSVLTNPLTLQTGIAPGPGGQRQSFFRVVNRVGTPINQETLQKLQAHLTLGSPQEKLRAVELAAVLMRVFGQVEDEQMQARAEEIRGHLLRTSNDSNPAVRAWTSYQIVRLMDEENRRRYVEVMLGDPSWEPRILGLLAVQSLEPAKWVALARPLAENDPEPLVRQLAAAVMDFADNPAAGQPVDDADVQQPVAQP